jgi:hypothetical protein
MTVHSGLLLTAVLFFVNRIPFFLTLSHKICSTAVNHVTDRKATTIFKAFEEIYRFYLQRGFKITDVHVDGEFAPLQAMIQAMPGGPRVNLASAKKHVPEFERRISVVKERSRSIRHSLPCNKIPKILIIYIVLHAVKLLNHFPAKGGILDTTSPKTIMSGETLHYKKHLSLQSGQCCQVHEEDAPRNSQLPRTKGPICLGPSGNVQGGCKFMTLNSMKKIVRYSWDAIQMPDTVIARVNELGRNEPEQFVFTDRSGHQISDVELPGVDGDENETPQELLPQELLNDEVENIDLENAPNIQNIETEEEAIPTDPHPIEPQTQVETVNDNDKVYEEPARAPNQINTKIT